MKETQLETHSLSETRTLAPHLASPREAPFSSQSLPTDLLRKSRGRLQLVAALVFFGFASDYVLGTIAWLTGGRTGNLLDSLAGLNANLVGIAWCSAMLAATTSRRLSDETILSIGLVFQVGVCMIVSLGNTMAAWSQVGQVPSLTWVTPVIIMFPLIIPNPPGRVLIASLASALTSPLAIMLLANSGKITTGGEDYARGTVPPLIATVFAFFGSRVVYGLGVQVRQWRRELERERELGSYRLESLIGRGGMGEVWRAKHRLIARPAAIKLIRPEVLGADGLEHQRIIDRFKREAEATASMRSPHTIEIYDFGLTDDGTFYYVMELLEGVDLDTLIRRFGAVSGDRAIHILVQICHSLGEAHERNLIHRDVKPANIFVCRHGREYDFVKVLDFGLVKASAAHGLKHHTLTREHTAMGTPAFMSPEQVVGQDTVDARSDIYSVGCVAYWLLTGVLVFDGDSAGKMMMSQVRDAPIAPSERSELSIPKALDELVLACLAKDPAGRPQSVDDLARALSALPMAREWTTARSREWWDTHLPART